MMSEVPETKKKNTDKLVCLMMSVLGITLPGPKIHIKSAVRIAVSQEMNLILDPFVPDVVNFSQPRQTGTRTPCQARLPTSPSRYHNGQTS